MKKKGISLIVLIITCVVIIVLATAIIVNIAQTNMIENAKEAVVKQDFKTMQDELTLYIADNYADTLGKFKAEELNVAENADIIKIIPSLKGTKYEEYVVIEKGKIAISDEMPDPDKTWALEALGEIKTTTNRPVADKIAPTAPTSIDLTVVENKIVAVANGATDDKGSVTYEYSLDKVIWQDNGEFENLETGNEYTVYVRAIDKAGNKSEIKEEKITLEPENVIVLYNRGNQCESITGGWTGLFADGNASCGHYKFEEDCMKLETWWGTWSRYNLKTNNKIDFSNVSKVFLDCEINNGSNSYAEITIGGGSVVLFKKTQAGYTYTGILEMDASAYSSQNVNLVISVANTGKIKINKIWLELK